MARTALAGLSEADYAPYEFADASTLAQQPPTVVEDDFEIDKDWDEIFSHLESRINSMKMWRYSWWAYWSTLAQYFLPRRYHWVISANLFNKGNPINQSIIDGTGVWAKNICASGMVEGLMPQTREWFKIKSAISSYEWDADEKAWAEDTEQRMYTVLGQSNFYGEMAQVAEDEVVFGTAVTIMYEDAQQIIRNYTPCTGEYFLAASASFAIDTLYREYLMTVAQIVEWFTLESCPQQVQDLWRQGGGSIDNEFIVAHAIEPNFDIAGRGASTGSTIKVVPGSFAFREVYWLRGVKTQAPLSKRGFHKKPFAVFRWAKTSNDPYGRGPGMDALGDNMQLQLETLRKDEALEKQVRPPMGADTAMKNEPSSIRPGDITYCNTEGGKKGFWPLFEMKFDLAAMREDLKDIGQRIEKYFLVDVWLAISQMEGVQPRNNFEIAERRGEKMQRLGPVIGLWKSEGAQPLLERLMDIMERKQMLKPKPPQMLRMPLKFDFLDMVTLAQLGTETAAMEQTFRVGGELATAAQAAQLPNPLRVLNLDESFRIYAERMSYPAKGLFTSSQVKQLDRVRQQAKQQAQAPAAAAAAVDAAKSLSQTPIGGGQTALTRMLGGQGGMFGGPGGGA
jgi:hypothetical protein